jgi:NAD(P)-dependent dehydrogenase (short-subunit alcohol dehydrogenase family)
MPCRPDRSYIITGGVGGFGLALAVWLSNRGARNLVLTSKRGMRTGGQRKVIQMLQKRGVQVRTHLLLPQHITTGISTRQNGSTSLLLVLEQSSVIKSMDEV